MYLLLSEGLLKNVILKLKIIVKVGIALTQQRITEMKEIIMTIKLYKKTGKKNLKYDLGMILIMKIMWN